jgi:Nidogen-like
MKKIKLRLIALLASAPLFLYGVTWPYVGYYDTKEDKLNAFQLLLIDRSDRASGDYDVEFDYVQILWDAGDVSGGSDGIWVGPDGSPARAGFASVGGSSYELPGSGSQNPLGAFLDSNLTTGLIHNSFNSGTPPVPGRYVFQFHNGVPLGTP